MLINLVSGLTTATRMEERTSWHYLVDLVQILDAAHSPTIRSQAQTYQIGCQLHRGDRLFEQTE